jgi:membrane protein implicated in regulation of membrane protease activity
MFALDGPAGAWLALALVSAVVELSMPHAGLMFVAIGAVAAAAVAFFSLGLTAQVVVFAVVVGFSLAVLRPSMLGRLAGRGVPSRTDTLVGREGVVTVDIEATMGAGRINVAGQDWAARSREAIAAGSRVKVVGADGIILEVTRV